MDEYVVCLPVISSRRRKDRIVVNSNVSAILVRLANVILTDERCNGRFILGYDGWGITRPGVWGDFRMKAARREELVDLPF